MGRHLHDGHCSNLRESPPLKCLVQVIFESSDQWYKIDPNLSNIQKPTISSTSLSPLDLLIKQYGDRNLGPLAAPHDPTALSPILAKYYWMDVLQGILLKTIGDWVSIPAPHEGFQGLEIAVQGYYNKICEEMGHLDVHTTTLRWINSTKE